MFVLQWKGPLLVISHGGVLYELNEVIPDFSREFLVLLGCFFFLFFSDVEILDRWCRCFPLQDLHKFSWSLLGCGLYFCSIYIMSARNTRGSQSAIFLNNKSKQGEERSKRTSKRKREEQTPTFWQDKFQHAHLSMKTEARWHLNYNKHQPPTKTKNRLH